MEIKKAPPQTDEEFGESMRLMLEDMGNVILTRIQAAEARGYRRGVEAAAQEAAKLAHEFDKTGNDYQISAVLECRHRIRALLPKDK